MLLSDRVLFLDGEALVIDKPAGLPVDAPRDGSISLENHLDLLKFGFKRWPLPVHRLDATPRAACSSRAIPRRTAASPVPSKAARRSEEHTYELQSLIRNSNAVSCPTPTT